MLLNYIRSGTHVVFGVGVSKLGAVALSVIAQQRVIIDDALSHTTSLPPPADTAHWHPSPAPPRSSFFPILSTSMLAHV